MVVTPSTKFTDTVYSYQYFILKNDSGNIDSEIKTKARKYLLHLTEYPDDFVQYMDSGLWFTASKQDTSRLFKYQIWSGNLYKLLQTLKAGEIAYYEDQQFGLFMVKCCKSPRLDMLKYPCRVEVYRRKY